MKLIGLTLSIGLLFNIALTKLMACSFDSSTVDHQTHSEENTNSKSQNEERHQCLHNCCHIKISKTTLPLIILTNYKIKNKNNIIPIYGAIINVPYQLFRPPIV